MKKVILAAVLLSDRKPCTVGQAAKDYFFKPGDKK